MLRRGLCYDARVQAFVSSYALASPAEPWNRAAETELFAGLARRDLAGVELPFYGSLHRHDAGWLVERLDPRWRLIVTLLPGTMERVGADPRFGLASADAAGRARALGFAAEAARTVAHLRGFLGRPAVAAVAVHSAPRLGAGAKSSLEAFADSLTRLRALDWGGAELLVEHCDAYCAAHAPDKGFLRVEDECAALKLSAGPTRARLLVNWGRSALERAPPAVRSSTCAARAKPICSRGFSSPARRRIIRTTARGRILMRRFQGRVPRPCSRARRRRPPSPPPGTSITSV